MLTYISPPGQLFLPRELFDSKVTDDKGNEKTLKGPLYFYGVPLTRNYVIAAIISLSTGILFTNKTVSSHMQTLGKAIKDKVANEKDPKKKALGKEVWESWEHGSPTARAAMKKHIEGIAAARLKGRNDDAEVKIALSLHPMLAFFIGRNGSLSSEKDKPANVLVDVSNHKTHRLPHGYTWGWYLYCHDKGVPGGLTKYPFPFGTWEDPLDFNKYVPLDDVAKSGPAEPAPLPGQVAPAEDKQ